VYGVGCRVQGVGVRVYGDLARALLGVAHLGQHLHVYHDLDYATFT
jgi:hypothetical protein